MTTSSSLSEDDKILSKMGEGTFGQVLECLDLEKMETVAIKIVRSLQKYREAAMIEIDVLQRLAIADISVMHDLRLIHTDLKPENILLVSSECIKVPDYKDLDGTTLVIYGAWVAFLLSFARRRAEKYFRRGLRLDWPEGATSSESVRAVHKLHRLENLVMQHVDHSAGDLIDLLQGLLRYDPTERLKAQEALGHPFFMRDRRRCGYSFMETVM
ncbi:putative Serine/threonine-protein kinase AFC2 [Cocos nucifera]|uniref:Putative Serine/threonine-protein kinase AFC2 n=1 Tax=Cocos nucifera TaxID=13894 RepID=A0A8K0MZT7_COCNU|nr:putative Serine/threonine-protein kinase AFC2 [Cocos nucifera]